MTAPSSSTLGTELGTAVPVSNIGFATYVANALTLGANYLTAEYFLPTNTTTTADATATTTDTVTAAPTHTTIGASSNPGVQGAMSPLRPPLAAVATYSPEKAPRRPDR